MCNLESKVEIHLIIYKIPSGGRFIYIGRKIKFPREENSSTSRGKFEGLCKPFYNGSKL